MKNILLVGTGKWGQRYIHTLSDFDVKLQTAGRNDWQNLIDKKPDGVIVCTPPQSHVEIAAHALERNIPTMIEKPLSFSLSEAGSLKNYTAPILVNHIHLFSEAYQQFRSTVHCKEITSLNANFLGSGYHNYSLLWDYAPHPLSLILDLTSRYPAKMKVANFSSTSKLKMDFGNFEADVSVGLSSLPKRDLTVEYDGLRLTYDDCQRPDSHKTPLHNALSVFLKSIDGEMDHRLGLSLGLQTVELLERCDQL